MRYVIVFLIGFFVGGLFGGDLGLFFKQSKDMITQKVNHEPTEPKEEVKLTFTEPPSSRPEYMEVKPVQTKPAEPVEPKPVVIKEVPTRQENVYSVQVASFKNKEQADKYVKDLVSQEYDAYIAPSNSIGKTTVYRVCIGETISLDQARALNEKLKPKFKDSFVYKF